MKFVIAPDKFKGSLTGFEFCDIVAEGLKTGLADPKIIKMPLADGGDGTIEVAQHYIQGEKRYLQINDPFFRPIEGSYLFSAKNKVAYIEMAEASGLKVLHAKEYDCVNATTFGTGELLRDALDKGAEEVILGIGGSATNDGGIGMATALGFKFLDSSGKILKGIGANLSKIRTIDASQAHPRIKKIRFKVASDVTNPLYGKNGAAYIYAKQKGATIEEIGLLDGGLRHFAKVILEQYKQNLQEISGAGAAGGIGGGAMVFLNAKLCSGIDLVKELANFDSTIEGADWIITGEGRLDGQTLSGKTIDGVLASAKQKNIPVAALCGSVAITEQQKTTMGLSYVKAISKGITDLEQAIKESRPNLLKATVDFTRALKK